MYFLSFYQLQQNFLRLNSKYFGICNKIIFLNQCFIHKLMKIVYCASREKKDWFPGGRLCCPSVERIIITRVKSPFSQVVRDIFLQHLQREEFYATMQMKMRTSAEQTSLTSQIHFNVPRRYFYQFWKIKSCFLYRKPDIFRFCSKMKVFLLLLVLICSYASCAIISSIIVKTVSAQKIK